MEHKQFEDFWESVKKVRLSAEEKARGRELLLRYMQMNPARFREQDRHQWQESIFGIINPNRFYKLMALAVVLLITVAAGGGVSLAAENALPGDVLYPVKVEVNENVRSVLAFSEEAKAEWKVEQTERRLQETEKLAAKGEFDSKAAAKVEAKFEQHTQKLSAIAAKLEAEGKVEAAAAIHSNLEAVLDAHEKILTALQSEANGEVEEIRIKLLTKTKEAKEARGRVEAKVAAKEGPQVREAAEGKLKAAQNKIAEVRAFIERNEARAGAEATAQAKAVLEDTEAVVVEGEAKMEEGAHGEAFVLFQQALGAAQGAKALVQGEADLEIDLKGTWFAEDEDEAEKQEDADGETEAEIEGEVENKTKIEIEL